MTLENNTHGLKVVGTRPIRPDGVEKVTGRANFGADRALPGMLYAKIKRSPHPHARIIISRWRRPRSSLRLMPRSRGVWLPNRPQETVARSRQKTAAGSSR